MRMDQLPTPCYVVDEDRLEENLKILAGVMEETGCRILLAQKAFSAYGLYPLIGKYLNGTTASGLFEARLGRQEMALHPELRERNLETHVFSAAYREDEFQEIAGLCGFYDASYFSRQFRRYVKVTPLEYREKHSNKKIRLFLRRSMTD